MAAESQHWYTRDGRPCYEVPAKDGRLRATTLRDARALGLVPSVTTVLQIVAKPQLEKWKINQAILAALTLPRVDDEPESDWLARIDADSRAQAQAAADEGTRIHDAIECSFRGHAVPRAYLAHVDATRAELTRLFPGVSDWVSEQSFAHAAGYGGKVDLHSPSAGIVVDLKGKDGDFSDRKRLAYDQHWQLAAYQRGLALPTTHCANIFVSRTHPGAVTSHVWSETDMAEGWAVFEAALRLWQAVKNFHSGDYQCHR
jgi:hypothetical protein